VRRKLDYQAEPFMIPGAKWHDPEGIAKKKRSVFFEDKQMVINLSPPPKR
jgi:hypothetical protein